MYPVPFASKSGGHDPPAPMGAPPLLGWEVGRGEGREGGEEGGGEGWRGRDGWVGTPPPL